MDLVLAYDERGIESISFLVLLWTVYEDNRWPMIPNRVFLWTSTSCRERHGKILKSTWSMIFITLCEDLEKMENRVSCKSISWVSFYSQMVYRLRYRERYDAVWIKFHTASLFYLGKLRQKMAIRTKP